MVRAPCCEKVGLKKGPWSPEEDRILVDYIQRHGYGNWRALPKKAGLLRCGKSCRLRWTNYLRPDIKRGNFTEEEEDAIISLHQNLGNRWSAIAARLPGRTDNEIKNVWNTYLKKRASREEEETPLGKPEPARSESSVSLQERACGDSLSSSEEISFSSFERGDQEGSDGRSNWLESLWVEDSSVESVDLGSLEAPAAAVTDDDDDEDDDETRFWLRIFKEAEHLENLTRDNPSDHVDLA